MTCTATNTLVQQNGSVTLKKTTSAGNTGLTSLSPSTFNLQLTAGGSTKASYSPSMSGFTTSSGQAVTLPAGTQYSFSEGTLPSAPTGTQWQAPAYSCTDGTTSLGSSFTLAANQNVTCTATNTLVQQNGSVTLKKTTSAGNTGLTSLSPSTFNLQLTAGGSTKASYSPSMSGFTTSSGQAVTLPAGTQYSFSEGTLPRLLTGTQWQTPAYSCTDGTTSLGLSFTLAANQNVTCTATNTLVQQQTGAVTLKKTTNAGKMARPRFQRPRSICN